jgi:carbonic anhydrase
VARRETSDALVLKFAPANLRIVHHEHVADAINNGHTIQVNYSEGDTLTVGAFTALFHGNNRPVQPLNGRPVFTDEVGGTN